MATKSLVSATATLGIERRGGGQGREDPGIPGCHPRSRPRVPRLLPPPLAAASARETRRSGADTRGEVQGDPRPAATTLVHPLRPRHTPAGRRPRGAQRARRDPPDAPFPPDLEVSGNRSGYPESSLTPQTSPLPPGCEHSLVGLRGRPTRLGRTGAAGGTVAPPGAQLRPEASEQDSGREGRAGAARGPVKLGPPAPRVSAHGRAALLPPPPPALRPSPPPGARRTPRPAAHRAPSIPLPPGEARAQAHSGTLRE